jgi:phage repressor protein C with HTH and peptisase S24 domain
MDSPASRLKAARQKAGYNGATEAARANRWTIPTYLGHENGSRDFDREAAKKYAKAFRTSAAWLMTGEGERDVAPTVPIVGYVGAGSEIFPMDDHEKGAALDEIEAPPGAGQNVVAVIVRGDSMYPAYRDRDRIYYERYDGPPLDLIGRECVVKLGDGRLYIKTLAGGSAPGLVTLLSFNHPPIVDVVIEWAAPVKWVQKAK